MNVKSIRRENLRALAKSVGSVSKLALRLNKAQSQVSHLIGKTPIKQVGDKIAAQVEAAFNKPAGWLDREHYCIEGILPIYHMRQGQSAILCPRVPLLDWQDVKDWSQGTYVAQAKAKPMLTTTVSVGTLAFALQVQDESMQAPSGMSFPVGAFIVADPDEVARCGNYVVVTLKSFEQRAILRQLVSDGNKQYLKPLNPCYPIAEYDIHTMIYGVVKQMMINFESYGIFY